MDLPKPHIHGEMSLERSIQNRRTVRSFDARLLTKEQWSQLMWSAQGITEENGFKRAAPSAGALYPMDVYSVVGEETVAGTPAGVYHYEVKSRSLSLVSKEDRRSSLARASLSQMWMAKAPLQVVVTANYDRITGKYGKRGIRYAMIEAGHIGQNLFLQAEALGLRAGIVGAFVDEEAIQVLGIPKTHEPLLIMPIGYER